MKFSVLVCVIFQLLFVHAQEIETEFIKEFQFNADVFIGVDDFENYYYIKNNTLHKKTSQQIFTYSNTQLGRITSVDITNPLKILVFYRDFNTVLFLDNQLNELTDSINFTSEFFSQQLTHVTISSNNNLWLYSLDDNVLQLWNHQSKKIQFTSHPLSYYTDDFKIIRQFSSYKNCWLVGEDKILKFNEYGTFMGIFNSKGNIDLTPFQNGYVFLKDNELYYQKTATEFQPIETKTESIIKSYSINSNHIYIFDGAKVFIFKIIKNK